MAKPSRIPNPFARSIAVVLDVSRREGFRVALIGGFALPFRGIQRATGDVDFLADEAGADALHAALLRAGARALHRGGDAANYGGTAELSPVDFIFARRERAREMLRRATPRALRGARLRVPVVDAEGIIGLKLQALVNAPARRAREEADIEALFAARAHTLDVELLRDYYRGAVERDRPIVGADVPDQATLRPSAPARDLDEFIEFLTRLEALFGPIVRASELTTGDRFLL